MSYHELIRRTRVGSAYTTDDGEEVPQHVLTAYDCGCGYRANVFMASEGRALESLRATPGQPCLVEVRGLRRDQPLARGVLRGCGAGEPDYWIEES